MARADFTIIDTSDEGIVSPRVREPDQMEVLLINEPSFLPPTLLSLGIN